jgi:hypothetical protein
VTLDLKEVMKECGVTIWKPGMLTVSGHRIVCVKDNVITAVRLENLQPYYVYPDTEVPDLTDMTTALILRTSVILQGVSIFKPKNTPEYLPKQEAENFVYSLFHLADRMKVFIDLPSLGPTLISTHEDEYLIPCEGELGNYPDFGIAIFVQTLTEEDPETQSYVTWRCLIPGYEGEHNMTLRGMLLYKIGEGPAEALKLAEQYGREAWQSYAEYRRSLPPSSEKRERKD